MNHTVKATVKPRLATHNLKHEFYELSKAIHQAGYCGGVGVYISEPHFNLIAFHPSLGQRIPEGMSVKIFGIELRPDFDNQTEETTEYSVDVPSWVFDGKDRTDFILEISSE